MSTKAFLLSLASSFVACAITWAACAFFIDNFPAVPTAVIAAATWGIFALMAGLCLHFLLGAPLEGVKKRLESFGKEKKGLSEYDAGDLPALHQALDAAEAVLTKERAFSAGFWQALPMAYLLVDTDEKATSTNRTCLDMLEIDEPVESCLGRTLADLFYNDPDRETAVGRSMREGQVFRNLEVTITGHKGRKTHVLANVFPIAGEKGKCVAGLCLYADVTKMKEAELQIMEKNKKLADVAGRLQDVAKLLLAKSDELSRGIEASTSFAAGVSTKLSEAAQLMGEMDASAREIAESAGNASAASDETRQKAESGAEVVERSVEGIKGIRDISETLKGDMGELDKRARDISQIMGVISDIADQTNLLALNAAIEAARAGESGRGFAVVADEVRKLAEKTMASTTDVGQAVSAIQQSTSRSMGSMDEALERVSQATELAGLSGRALEEIRATAEVTAGQVEGMAGSCQEQSAGSRRIADMIGEIDGMVRQSAEGMGGLSQAVADLASQAHDLDALVRELKG